MYSRLHKPRPESTLDKKIHNVCHVQTPHHDTLEQSTCSNFQRECSPTFVKDNRELDNKLTNETEVTDITIQVNSNSVDNITASDSIKDHYSTNICDSVHISSIPETRLDHLHEASNKELILQENCQSRTCHYSLSSMENSEDIKHASAIKFGSCVKKFLEFEKQDSNEEKEDKYEHMHEEHFCKIEEQMSPIPVKSPKNLKFADTDTTISTSLDTQKSDKECKRSNFTNSTALVKYLVENEANKFDTFVSDSVKSSTKNEFSDLNFVKENFNIENNEENDFECHGTVLTHQNDLILKNNVYIVNVANSSEMQFEKPEIIETLTTDIDSRVQPCKESNKNFNIMAPNSFSDTTAHNFEDNHNFILKQPVQVNEMPNTTLRSHKSRKKILNEKKSISSGWKEELGTVIEHKTTDNIIASISKTRSKVGKTKSRLTRNQKRDRQKIATAEIGVADDDSGIQGDIYEFSEKESNLEDIRIPSIMRRGKPETRHTSVLASHLEEMQYNDECNKAEPPVLIPQEPWPPTSCNQNQLADSDGSSQSRENSVDSESLKR